VRRIERHQRREAVAPVGDVIQRVGVGSLVGIEHPQLRTDGAGIGERQADIETEPGGRIVERKICSALFCLATTMLGSLLGGASLL